MVFFVHELKCELRYYIENVFCPYRYLNYAPRVANLLSLNSEFFHSLVKPERLKNVKMTNRFVVQIHRE